MRVPSSGVVGIFADSTFAVAQRVMAVAFVPHTIIPLEADSLTVHLLPDLPHAIQTACYDETFDRGLVVAAGISRSLTLVPGQSWVWHESPQPHLHHPRHLLRIHSQGSYAYPRPYPMIGAGARDGQGRVGEPCL